MNIKTLIQRNNGVRIQDRRNIIIITNNNLKMSELIYTNNLASFMENSNPAQGKIPGK